MIGQAILHYKILEKLGEGGMGVVYKAQDTKLDRTVALKFLPPHLSASDIDKARFIQEAKAASALNHPNICTIHSIDEHEGQLFIAMEFVDGQTLQQRKISLSLKQAIDISIQVAEGLAAAHEKGIVHRDIKPENIMVRKDSIVQIMDFGLAKLRGASRLTKTGSTVGTVGYMSPEQVQGLETDHRTDIFSLGVILYELLTGQSPYKSDHEAAINYEIVNADPQRISILKPDIEPELEMIVFDCLAKDPTERFQSAAELARNLRRFTKVSSRTRMSKTPNALPSGNRGADQSPLVRSDRRWLMVAAAFGAGVVISIGTMFLVLTREDSPSSLQGTRLRASINLPAEAPLILAYDRPTIGFNSPVIAISPQGGWLSYVAKTTSGQMLYLVDISTGEIRPLRGTEGAIHSFFSPDGEWIGFLTQDRVKKTLLQGGTVISLCEATTPVLAWWTQSGTIYFTEHQNNALSRVSIDGTGKKSLVSNLDFLPSALLPDETHILAVKKHSISDDYSEILLVNLQTLKEKTLVRSGYAPQFILPGYILFGRASDLMAVRFDMSSTDVIGEPVAVVSGVTMESLFGILHATSSNTGMLAFIPGYDISVGKPAWVNSRGEVQYLSMPEKVYGVIDLSPDNRRLAAHVADVKDYVWIWDIKRQEGRRIPSDVAEGWPVWSHSGHKLASTAIRTAGPGILVRDLTEEGSVSNIMKIDIDAWAAGWSPDDNVLSVSTRGQPKGGVMLVGLDKKIDSTGFEGAFPLISPDAKLVAFKSVETGREEVFLCSYPGGKPVGQVSTSGGTEPLWMPSGELFYRNGRRWFSTHVTTSPQPRWDPPRLAFDTDFIDTPGWSYDVSRDGQRLLVVKSTKQITSTRIDILTNWFEAFND